jgi:hypothetical protein
MDYQLLQSDIMKTIRISETNINCFNTINSNYINPFSIINFHDNLNRVKVDDIIDWVFAEHFSYLSLCEFFRNNEISSIKEMIIMNGNTDQICECCGNTLLHLAVYINSLEIADLVIK